jgi:hypothetical protein
MLGAADMPIGCALTFSRHLFFLFSAPKTPMAGTSPAIVPIAKNNRSD